MSELIQTKECLVHYLTTKQIASKYPPKSANVTSRLRKLVMTDDLQGKFSHNGKVKKLKFDSLGGGVYAASIESNKY